MNPINPRKLFLYLLIASVSLSALLGIGVIVFGNFGELETKILLTTLTVTFTSLLGLACGACLETGRARWLPLAGIVAAIAMGAMWIVVIWSTGSNETLIFKILLSLTELALATALLSLVTIARLDRRFLWSRVVLHVAIWSMFSISMVLVWTEISAPSDLTTRVLSVLGIVAASLTVVTPVFHKLSRHDDEIGDAERLDAEIESLKARLEELEARRASIETPAANDYEN